MNNEEHIWYFVPLGVLSYKTLFYATRILLVRVCETTLTKTQIHWTRINFTRILSSWLQIILLHWLSPWERSSLRSLHIVNVGRHNSSTGAVISRQWDSRVARDHNDTPAVKIAHGAPVFGLKWMDTIIRLHGYYAVTGNEFSWWLCVHLIDEGQVSKIC